MVKKYVGIDLLKIYKKDICKGDIHATLAWGDPIESINTTEVEISTPEGKKKGFIRSEDFLVAEANVVKYAQVDVEQGDASILEHPNGKIMIIDGGRTDLLGRYLATRYQDTSSEKPLDIETIIITHFDADHFQGFNELHKNNKRLLARKKIFIYPKGIYHNGLIKIVNRKIHEDNGEKYISNLVDDFTNDPDEQISEDFTEFKKTVKEWKEKYGDIKIKRIAFNNDNVFNSFNNEDFSIKVLNPHENEFNDQLMLSTFTKESQKKLKKNESENIENTKKIELGSIINANSVVLQIKYGNVALLLTGDINTKSQNFLVKKFKNHQTSLKSEILKVPHHGSSDFSKDFLAKVSPIISLISSGDEPGAEYIHPRAVLIGALGKFSRIDEPIILITELAAFIQSIKEPKEILESLKEKILNLFQKKTPGILHVRFNKNRILVFTHSGKKGKKEVYTFKYKDNAWSPDVIVAK